MDGNPMDICECGWWRCRHGGVGEYSIKVCGQFRLKTSYTEIEARRARNRRHMNYIHGACLVLLVMWIGLSVYNGMLAQVPQTHRFGQIRISSL
jgi:hypothetical protein